MGRGICGCNGSVVISEHFENQSSQNAWNATLSIKENKVMKPLQWKDFGRRNSGLPSEMGKGWAKNEIRKR